jgi:hypothetical protein
MGKVIYDRNKKVLESGMHVEVQYCSGKYGQTQKVTGVLKEADPYGGVYIILDSNHHPFYKGSDYYKGGDTFYACGVFEHDFTLKALVGYRKFEDFEHGHECWVEIK